MLTNPRDAFIGQSRSSNIVTFHITRCTVVRPTCKVNGKGPNFDPNDIKILKIFKFELNVHDYVPEFYTSANFHFKPFSGASAQIGDILRFCDFFPGWLYCIFCLIFSRSCTQFEPVDGFSRFMAHMMCFRPRTVFLVVSTILEFIWG